jgi:hypothetical protein
MSRIGAVYPLPEDSSMRLISRGFLCIMLASLLGLTRDAQAQRLPDAPATQTVT